MIKDNQSSLNRLHVVLDACVTAFSYIFAWYIVIGSGWANMLGNKTLGADFYFAALVFIVPGYLLLYSFFNLYTPKRVLGRRNEFGKILKANTIGLLIFGLVLYLGRKNPYLFNFSQRLVVYFHLINVIMITAERNAIRIVLRSMRSKGYNQKHILLVGYSDAAKGFIDRVRSNPQWGYQIRGILDDNHERGTEYNGMKVIGTLEDLTYILEQNSLDEIAITLSLSEYEKLRHIVNLCEKTGVHTKFIPDYGNVIPTVPY
ncbi:MAG: undecaprenyl-phosphate glucose phosphotransferase, partial [Lachnospiraceae bacterium]|nr:undecaprenyl-phosphate glucose phosphotransferase [Lachnospiraceae bacterium]